MIRPVARSARPTVAIIAELSSDGTGLGQPGPDDDLHVDLSLLEFVDVAGIRRIVKVADSAPEARRLVLHGLPPTIRRVMSIVGWADHPKLVIDEASP